MHGSNGYASEIEDVIRSSEIRYGYATSSFSYTTIVSDYGRRFEWGVRVSNLPDNLFSACEISTSMNSYSHSSVGAVYAFEEMLHRTSQCIFCSSSGISSIDTGSVPWGKYTTTVLWPVGMGTFDLYSRTSGTRWRLEHWYDGHLVSCVTEINTEISERRSSYSCLYNILPYSVYSKNFYSTGCWSLSYYSYFTQTTTSQTGTVQAEKEFVVKYFTAWAS